MSRPGNSSKELFEQLTKLPFRTSTQSIIAAYSELSMKIEQNTHNFDVKFYNNCHIIMQHLECDVAM